MNILNKLTIKNLKMNKKRTVVTIIGIMLSVALICAVAGMVTSFQKTLANRAKITNGNYHVMFEDVKKDDTTYITQNKKTESYFMTQNVGYAKFDKIENEYKPYLYIVEYDDDALNHGGVNLIEGRFPQNNNEIIVPASLNYSGKANVTIGDKLKLDVGDRMSDGYKLNQNNPIYDEEGNIQNETLDIKFSREYTIVGTFSLLSTESYDAPGYTTISHMDLKQDELNVAALCYNPNQFKSLIEEVNDVKSYEEVGKYQYTFNEDLLRWQGANLSDGTLTTIYSLAGIIIAIIVVSSIFVIKNSFSISITERIRQYGMFSSVGATSKQIKRNVLFEGFVLGLIGIPLGIILGMIAIMIVLWLINLILADFLDGIKFVYSVPLIPILISVLVGIITIFLSCLIPAIKASKVSPIDAIRSSNDIKIKSKKLKTPKLFKKLFKIGGEISYKNLKRCKKKYRTTVISIVVSISIFIALSSFIEYGFKLSGVYYKDLNYNFIVYEQENDGKTTYEEFKKISEMDTIKHYSIVKSENIAVDSKYLTDKYCNIINADKSENQYLTVVSIDSDIYDDYLKKLSISNLEDKAILVDNMTYYNEDNKYENIRTTNIKENDKIEGIIDKEDTKKTVTMEIAKVTAQKPLGLASEGFATLIVSDETFNEIYGNNYYINEITIDSTDTYKLSDDLEELKKSNDLFQNISYINYDEEMRAQNAMVLVISIFLYGFIAVITLIGVTNIFNTITTNMILRSKEFAMLKSIGMTNKEFNNMIRLESILYGLKALIIGIPIGLLLSYFMYKSFANTLETGYIIPWLSIIISIFFVFIIIGITMKYSVSKINKQNIIETIRNDNI